MTSGPPCRRPNRNERTVDAMEGRPRARSICTRRHGLVRVVSLRGHPASRSGRGLDEGKIQMRERKLNDTSRTWQHKHNNTARQQDGPAPPRRSKLARGETAALLLAVL